MSLKQHRKTALALAFGVGSFVSLQSIAYGDDDAADEARHIFFPADVQAPEWVEARRASQLASREEFKVFHDFEFTDVQPRSGINFLHRIVDDVGLDYKAVHYDHGNGLAVADVDGDGHLDVYLVSQAGPNGLFRNRGDGTFEDITSRAGVALPVQVGVAASFADTDNDGDADLYVTNVRAPNVLFENQGDGTFKDVSAQSGLGYSEHSSAAVFFDYDRDGLLDLLLAVVGEYTTDVERLVQGTPPAESLAEPVTYFVGHRDAFAGHMKAERSRRSMIFRNLGDNRFEEVTSALGFTDTSWTGDATPTDFNRDGWQDLYILNMQGHDQYWLNREGKKFERASRKFFPSTPWGSMGVKSFDYNNDGYLDLLITDMHSDMSEKIRVDQEKLKANWIEKNWAPAFLRSEGRSIYGNALFRNDGNDGFTEVSDALNVENYWPWGVSVGDLNADGWLDTFITSSMNYPFRYAPNTLLLNNAGNGFVDAEYVLGVEPRRDNRTSKPWILLDCNGTHRMRPDCVGQATDLIINGALGSRSSVIFDMDADGDLDIITSELGDVPQVLRSNLAQVHKATGESLHFVKVSLRGTASNRDALGARVVVGAGEDRWVQVLDGRSGYLSQSRKPLYFGLGEHAEIDYVEVTWPAGRTERFTKNLRVNGLIELREGRD